MEKKKILVIDDEPSVHRLLEIILEDEGFLVVGPGEGGDPSQYMAKGKPDVIILDIMMPEVNGFDILRMLKDDDDTRDIPVIILSVRSFEEDMERADSLGAEIYMTKPFQPAELVKAIREILSSNSASR
jgi:DNA-binding response OmpR family regulator